MALSPRLKMLPVNEYVGVNRNDPIHLYAWPIIGAFYRRRVEMCLAELRGGQRVLEIGFGSGVAFLNLHDAYQEIHGLDLTAAVDEITRVFKAKGIAAQLKNGSVLEMPYADGWFDSVLLVSILEHLKPGDQLKAFAEIERVLKPGGQVVYGVPIERPLMVFLFRLLGHDIRQEHFSTEKDVAQAARTRLRELRIVPLNSLFGPVYQVGHFVKQG